jgi:hypothetical protein
MLEKWAKEVGEGIEMEAERALNMPAMMDEVKGETGDLPMQSKLHEY